MLHMTNHCCCLLWTTTTCVTGTWAPGRGRHVGRPRGLRGGARRKTRRSTIGGWLSIRGPERGFPTARGVSTSILLNLLGPLYSDPLSDFGGQKRTVDEKMVLPIADMTAGESRHYCHRRLRSFSRSDTNPTTGWTRDLRRRSRQLRTVSVVGRILCGGHHIIAHIVRGSLGEGAGRTNTLHRGNNSAKAGSD